jgi:hypothetical protein
VIKSAATCCDAGRFISVIIKGRCTGRKVDETTQPSVERMRASRGTATFFPLAASYRFCGDRGADREQVELGSGLRHEQEGRESRGTKGGRELMEKRRGTSASLYLAKDRAGGESGHGAARPDGVIC